MLGDTLPTVVCVIYCIVVLSMTTLVMDNILTVATVSSEYNNTGYHVLINSQQYRPTLLVIDAEEQGKFPHIELFNTKTSSRLGYCYYKENEDNHECDILACSSSGYDQTLRFIFVHDKKAMNAFNHAELFTRRTSSNLTYMFNVENEADVECEEWVCNNDGICSCDMLDEVSHNILDVTPSCHTPPVQFLQYTTMMKHRKAWGGMKGQYGGSGRHKRQSYNMSNIGHVVHNGGGYDCDIFIWQQLCSSGMPPHPGPETEAWMACCYDNNNDAAEQFEMLLSSAETHDVPQPSAQHNGLLVDKPSPQHVSGANVSDDQVHEAIYYTPTILDARCSGATRVRNVIPTVLVFALRNLQKAVAAYRLTEFIGLPRPHKTTREYDLLFGGGTQHMPTYWPIVGDNHWRSIFFDTNLKQVFLIDPRGGDGWRHSEVGSQILQTLGEAEQLTQKLLFTVHIVKCSPQGDTFQCGVWIIWFAQIICMWEQATANKNVGCDKSLDDFIKDEMTSWGITPEDSDRVNQNRESAHQLRVLYRAYVTNPRNKQIEPADGMYSPMSTMTVDGHFHEDFPHDYVPETTHAGNASSTAPKPFSKVPCMRPQCCQHWLRCCSLSDLERLPPCQHATEEERTASAIATGMNPGIRVYRKYMY
jgi:hypothetical protein